MSSPSTTPDVAALQARIQELEQVLAAHQSITTTPTPLTTPTLDLKPTSTSDDTPETDVVSHDERLRHMLEQMAEIEKQRESLESAYKSAQHALISRYESESRSLLQSYLDAYTPSAAINTPLLQAAKEMLTEGMYIEINAVSLDDYLLCYPTQNHAYRSSTASSSLRSTGYHHFMNQPIHPRVGDLDPLSLAAAAAITAKGSSTSPSPFPDYVKSIIREREQEQHEKERIVREEIEKQEREHEKKRKAGELLEQRADMALNQVMPLFPYLTIEQCMKALRLNQDNAERTVEWILGKGQDELEILLVEDVAETKSPEATETITSTSSSSLSSSSDTMPTQPRLYRQMTAPDKKLLFKVSNITPELTLLLQPLMDRNRIPIINSDNELNATYNGYATAVAKLKIPLVHFGKLDYRLVLSESERACIDADITSRIPTIIYQVHDDACSPLYVDPLVPLHDYDIDFNSSRHTITRVAHRKDGPIQFKAQLEEGLNHNPLMHMKPIELYSQVLDDGTHNIIHMHVNDLKDDLTVDVVNLTGTDKEIKDYHDFPKDVAGRDLSYRIVVRDQKVIAILYPSGGTVKEAKFVEHVLPTIGSFLSLPGDRLARLHHVPIGLIVTNKTGGVDDESKMKTNYKQTGQCSHKHPADLTGFVDVDILFASGSLVDPPMHEAIPYCRIHTATPEQSNQYQQKHSTYATDAVSEIETKLEIIEKALANTTASREEQSAMTVAMDNLRTRILALQQQPIVKSSSTYTNAGLDARIPKILQAVERRKRAAAFESRSPAMKPATPNLVTSTASMTISSSPSSSPTNKRRADVADGSNDEKRQKMNC